LSILELLMVTPGEPTGSVPPVTGTIYGETRPLLVVKDHTGPVTTGPLLSLASTFQ
jgi:hypothetical protein